MSSPTARARARLQTAPARQRFELGRRGPIHCRDTRSASVRSRRRPRGRRQNVDADEGRREAHRRAGGAGRPELPGPHAQAQAARVADVASAPSGESRRRMVFCRRGQEGAAVRWHANQRHHEACRAATACPAPRPSPRAPTRFATPPGRIIGCHSSPPPPAPAAPAPRTPATRPAIARHSPAPLHSTAHVPGRMGRPEQQRRSRR